ncbi:MAG: LPS export ABC transporter permease LptG [Alphaproteobacteria bacterium]|nr:LPS export ABC transporter permease LptG [Alphaproteobacteria bacterium]
MKPTSIFGKYLVKQILFNFLAVLLMVLSVVMLFEIVEILRRTSDRNDADIWFVLEMAITKMPKTIEMVFPFVMMIAAMATFWKVSKTNEYVIMRAAGVSVWGFLIPVLAATFSIGVLNVALVNPVAAYMYDLYETLEYRFETKNPKAVLFSDQGLWIREAIDNDNIMVLQAKSLRQENDGLLMRKVTILEMDRNSQPGRRLEAFAANLREGRFELKDVCIYRAGMPKETLNSLDYKTNLDENRIKDNFVAPEAISFWKLPDTIRFYEMSGFSVVRHSLRYLSLLISPLLLCAMVLVAAVFALRPNTRKGGVMFLIVGGITTGFVVYFLSQLVYAFGINGDIPVGLAVITPTAIISLIAVSMLLHLEDG